MQKGFARPGYFFIDTKGIIREKFFEAKYRERLSGNSLLSKLFPELGQEVTETLEAPHLQLALEQSDRTGIPGSRITLVAELRLPPEVHVYAPGTQGYKPIKLVIDPMPVMEFKPVNGVSVTTLEAILYEFAGCESHLSEDEVKAHLSKAGVSAGEQRQIIDHLCSLAFLGLQVRPGDYRFAEDPAEQKRNLVLAKQSLRPGEQLMFAVHAAFWAFLEVAAA
jgi:hypothetical protein